MPDKMKALFKGEYVEIHDAEGNVAERRPAFFLEGVPARHLSQEEWDALPKETQEEVRASGLYEVRTEAEMSGSTGGRRGSAPAPVEEKE